jgi:membrane protease subunit (stomatin/prohibitin family)
VSVRAFGRWGFRIRDCRAFLVQIVGSQISASGSGYIDSGRVEEYFLGEVIQRLSDALAKFFVEKNASIFQVAARINDLSSFIAKDIGPEFERFGIEIVNFNVERISIPEEEQKRFQEILGRRMEIDQISKAQVGLAYTTMRTFDTLETAAGNEAGSAGQLLSAGLGLGAGLGAGMPIGQKIGEVMNVQPQNSQLDDPMAKLNKLKQLLENGLISQEDFDKKKQQILDSI